MKTGRPKSGIATLGKMIVRPQRGIAILGKQKLLKHWIM